MKCPNCGSDRLTKCDRNASGTQRYECMECCKKFTPVPNKRGGSKPKYGKVAQTSAERKRRERARKRQQKNDNK